MVSGCFGTCPTFKENRAAYIGFLALEVIAFALMIIATTNVLNLPPVGMGLFIGGSAVAIVGIATMCCCWKRITLTTTTQLQNLNGDRFIQVAEQLGSEMKNKMQDLESWACIIVKTNKHGVFITSFKVFDSLSMDELQKYIPSQGPTVSTISARFIVIGKNKAGYFALLQDDTLQEAPAYIDKMRAGELIKHCKSNRFGQVDIHLNEAGLFVNPEDRG